MNSPRSCRALWLLLLAFLGCVRPAQAQSAGDPIYVFHTSQGSLRVQLFPDIAPQTVANFLGYVGRGDYNGSFLHRSVSGFIVQGGGYRYENGSVVTITEQAPVANEFHLSNLRGTIAMAKLGNDPNSATDQWFFNEADNSANLDHQNGGFTVFGKVVDAPSLAVMDKIAALQVINAGSPFDQLPVVNYQSGPVMGSNLVVVSTITPPFTAIHLAAAPGGASRVLWTSAAGAAFVQAVSSGGAVSYSATFGPYNGASAKSIAVAPDGTTRLLWTNTNGTAAVWTLSASGTVTSYGTSYGPYSGATAAGIAVTSDGKTRLLWNNTQGAAQVWTLDSTGKAAAYGPTFGPYGGGAHVLAIGGGTDNDARLLWNNSAGQFSAWTLNPDSSVGSYGHLYGPYNGASAKAVSGGVNVQSHLLWVNTNGTAAVWTVNKDGTAASYGTTYGPYAGSGAVDESVGTDGTVRLLWTNTSGQAQVWNVSPTGSLTYSPTLGPF